MLHLPKLLLDHGAITALPGELIALGILRPLLITDTGLRSCGTVARVCDVASSLADIFDGVTENPLYSDCDWAADRYRRAGCDGIVALGGGSVIDAAKLTAVLAGHGGCAIDYAGNMGSVDRRVVPLVAVPTTAGTGSEATPNAGVHRNASSAPTDFSSPHILPRLAICDPAMTSTLPPSLTAATGIDALTHCIEGYLAATVSPIVDAVALDGIARVCRHLDAARRDGHDQDARWHMMMAAFQGGVAIQKGLGPAHAIAISCGDQGVHHGKLSAIGLLASLDILADRFASKLKDVAAAMELRPGQAVKAGLAGLMQRLELPTTLAAAGYAILNLDELASHANASFFNATSSCHPSTEEYKSMIRSVAA